jgi:hypothetical protein
MSIARGGLKFVELALAEGVPENGKPRQVRNDLLELLEALASELGCTREQAGEIASGARKAVDKASGHGVIVVQGRHDRDRCGGLLRDPRRALISHDDCVHLETDQLVSARAGNRSRFHCAPRNSIRMFSPST